MANDGGHGISITGNVTGIVQSGSHARAEYTHHQEAPAPGEAPELRALLAAVDALRAQLRVLAPGELPPAAAEVAGQALDEVAQAAAEERRPDAGEDGQGGQGGQDGQGGQGGGRVRRAVFTLTGALGAATALTEALQALIAAAAPWF
ncbi:hypothetical protein [Kitasatospora sp. NPDC087314]|uniref:hypothetical protein n=1 Tax=Kitasatospora sp. NPDC087314 TaxID=3364068 RepID=UPI003817A61E